MKVQASKDSGAVTFQTAEFDALGRRIKKVVTKSGTNDATTVYFYEGHKIIETRLGGSTFHQQFIHGTRYIDELVMMRLKSKGDLYVHQDANWNVVGLTDLGGRVVERYAYLPYGQVTVFQETGYGDRDGDQDVDSTDKGTLGDTCPGTVSGACRILDLDFDGDYDVIDLAAFNSLPQGYQIQPGLASTNVNQPFAHQGLLFESEIGSYQNRARQYDPAKRRFLQRDPAGYKEGLNLLATPRLNPLTALDPSGKMLWICIRPVGFLPGNHAYLWDDSYPEGRSCGMSGLSGSDSSGGSNDGGYPGSGEDGPYSPDNPTGDCCWPVPGSDGIEQAAFGCCRDHANDGMWFPRLNDCHNAVDDCFGAVGISPPPSPDSACSDYPRGCNSNYCKGGS